MLRRLAQRQHLARHPRPALHTSMPPAILPTCYTALSCAIAASGKLQHLPEQIVPLLQHWRAKYAILDACLQLDTLHGPCAVLPDLASITALAAAEECVATLGTLPTTWQECTQAIIKATAAIAQAKDDLATVEDLPPAAMWAPTPACAISPAEALEGANELTAATARSAKLWETAISQITADHARLQSACVAARQAVGQPGAAQADLAGLRLLSSAIQQSAEALDQQLASDTLRELHALSANWRFKAAMNS